MSDTNLDRTGVLKPGRDDVPPAERATVVSDSSLSPDSLAPSPANRSDPERLGPFRVIRKLGQGGMGAVYLARDDRDGTEKAIKVLSREATPDGQAIRRFQKEARLLSEVQHPHVTNLLEVGEDEGTCFLVMEFVDGLDLSSLLAKTGVLPERLALEIVRDVADALSVAHDRHIIHRDIKPANILLAATADAGANAGPKAGGDRAAAVVEAVRQGVKPVVKLSDFGLARHREQTASMELTRTGAMIGTPYYIAPEQCADGQDVCPSTDLYSLGATLFELLAGRPPFKSSDPVKLIKLHCFEEPPDLRKLNPLVSDGVAQLVARLLEKHPSRRPANGSQLRDEIDRLLRGDASDLELHPRIPVATGRVVEADWVWTLKASPEELWPLVSNTERINCAVGVPAVEYETERDAHGALQKRGNFRMGGMTLSWIEHPFEWLEGRRLGVLREFQKGPFQWFLSIVELTPLAEGGTRLTHTVRIATRGLLGRLLAHIEVNVKGKKALDRVYPRIDAVVTGRLQGSATVDPFVPAVTLRKSTAKKFDRCWDELQMSAVDSRCSDLLVQFLRESPEQELARIRPRVLARRLNVAADMLTEACLQACHVGLLELHWDILCPTCRVSSSVAETLAEIDRHVRCEACDLDFNVDFANAVELIFRVHPALRHADLKTYCIGGPEHAPHVLAQARLNAGEAFEWDLALDANTYVVRGPQLPGAVELVVRADKGTSRVSLSLSPDFRPTQAHYLRAGRVQLNLRNKYEHPLLLRLERTVSSRDVVTAADAGRLPLFRELFPGETLSREQLADSVVDGRSKR